jgi:hypothetical protein
MSSDKQSEIKAQKTNPRAMETSKPFASTMSPPLGLASAAASDGRQRCVVSSLRSEGGVDNTTTAGQSRARLGAAPRVVFSECFNCMRAFPFAKLAQRRIAVYELPNREHPAPGS